jgi:hypothetical protein
MKTLQRIVVLVLALFISVPANAYNPYEDYIRNRETNRSGTQQQEKYTPVYVQSGKQPFISAGIDADAQLRFKSTGPRKQRYTRPGNLRYDARYYNGRKTGGWKTDQVDRNYYIGRSIEEGKYD